MQEVKQWLIIDHSEDDTLLTGLITEVRTAFEGACKNHLVPSTIELLIDISAGGQFFLPRVPVTSFTKAELRQDSAFTVLTAWQDYEYFEGIYMAKRIGVHKLTYEVGYDNDDPTTKTPYNIILAMLHEIADRYRNRGDGANKEGFNPYAESVLQSITQMAWL